MKPHFLMRNLRLRCKVTEEILVRRKTVSRPQGPSVGHTPSISEHHDSQSFPSQSLSFSGPYTTAPTPRPRADSGPGKQRGSFLPGLWVPLQERRTIHAPMQFPGGTPDPCIRKPHPNMPFTPSSSSDEARGQAQSQGPGIRIFKGNLIQSIHHKAKGTDHTLFPR